MARTLYSRSLILGAMLSAVAQAELAATFTAGGTADARLDRLPALLVKAGEPVTPFVAPGPFEVVWEGKLTLSQRMRPVFSFDGSGEASLMINDKEMLVESGTLGSKHSDRSRLNAGEHDIRIKFKSLPDGSGHFRLLWEEDGMVKHPVPPTAFKVEAAGPVKLGELQRHGRELFATNHCAKCHVSATGFGATPMPEMQEFGPLLFSSGDRVTEEWLQRWIASTHELRPTTRMPELVDAATEKGRQEAADIASYIASLTLGGAPGEAHDPALAAKGGETFHMLGCVACHIRPDQEEAPTDGHPRVPLNNVASKYKPGGLEAFLRSPQANHPSTSMPDFGFSDEEVKALTAYLTEASKGKETKLAEKIPAGDKTRGEELVKSLHCGSCHPGLPMAASVTTPGLEQVFAKDWTAGGCVAPPDKRGKAPKLNLNDEERTALVAFSKVGVEPLGRDTPGEYAHRQVNSQRCVACHVLDSDESWLQSLHAESRSLVADLAHLDERVTQDRPLLTYMGEMLQTSALEGMLDGTFKPRPRPWLLMRMPAFASRAEPLAEGLARMHGLDTAPEPEMKLNPEMVAIGRMLVGSEGFGCVTCHAVGDAHATAAFEVEGVNLALTPRRLRDEYFYHWMDNPRLVNPTTKMPRYSDGEKSLRGDVLDGDARKQFEAIRQYIESRK